MLGEKTTATALPELPLNAWEPTKETLHLWIQIVGKIRLATVAPRNHWWHVPLYVDVGGLTTGPMRHAGVPFAIDLDFVDHRLVVRADDGRREEFSLHDGLSVAVFYRELFARLGRLGIEVPILARPYGVPMDTPFAEDTEHASYDRTWVERWSRVLSWSDAVFQEFAGWFAGKASPVHLFWHSLDLAHSRFSGRRVAPPPGADPVTREAYTHEVISFGFWPGDRQTRTPAFYSYTNPEPAGLAVRPLRPAEAFWAEVGRSHLATLLLHDVCAAADPRTTVLQFLRSSYDAGAGAAHWPAGELISSWCPADYR